MHLRTTQECSFATVYHSLYATVAYPDMQRWHKVNDTPSHLTRRRWVAFGRQPDVTPQQQVDGHADSVQPGAVGRRVLARLVEARPAHEATRGPLAVDDAAAAATPGTEGDDEDESALCSLLDIAAALEEAGVAINFKGMSNKRLGSVIRLPLGGASGSTQRATLREGGAAIVRGIASRINPDRRRAGPAAVSRDEAACGCRPRRHREPGGVVPRRGEEETAKARAAPAPVGSRAHDRSAWLHAAHAQARAKHQHLKVRRPCAPMLALGALGRRKEPPVGGESAVTAPMLRTPRPPQVRVPRDPPARADLWPRGVG